MKKILCLFAFLLLLPMQSIADDSEQCQLSYSYWLCYQVGSIEKDVVLVISNISLSSANTCSNEKEKEFMEKIKKETNDKFIPVFSPNCIDYQNIQEARKDLKKKIEIAKKRDLRVIFINFSK